MSDVLDTAHSEPAPLTEGSGYQPRQLVLLGCGTAHMQVMLRLAARPLLGARVTLITPHREQMVAAMLHGLVSGYYSREECVVAVEPLARRCGIRWLPRSVKALDAGQQILRLDDGSIQPYDWLSMDTGPVQNRSRVETTLPGAREFGMFLRPLENFVQLWPRVVELASQRGLRVAVVGGGTDAAELALAIRQRMPQAAITLLCGNTELAPGTPEALRQRLVQQVKACGITLLQDVALEIQEGQVRLGCGAWLACDVPVVATGAQSPAWLAASGLGLDADGFIAVDANQRSTSHANVFAVGAISARSDATVPGLAPDAMPAGPALAANLAAAVDAGALKPYQPSRQPLQILSYGRRRALLQWAGYSAQGRWVWWLKNWLNRRFIRRFT